MTWEEVLKLPLGTKVRLPHWPPIDCIWQIDEDGKGRRNFRNDGCKDNECLDIRDRFDFSFQVTWEIVKG